MKKTSFLKKLTAMAATLAMTCVMAVGAFAAEPAVDYKLDSASISVGETWTMSVPAGGMYDWNLSSEYIAYGPSMADKEGVLKQVGYETANGVSTITYEAMMPGTCTVTLTDRSFAKIASSRKSLRSLQVCLPLANSTMVSINSSSNCGIALPWIS